MRKLALSLLLCIAFSLTACSPEKGAWDTAAALQGSLTAAQAKYQTSCSASPSQQVCKLINQAISAQNALITAAQTYCGWSSTVPPEPGTKCVPVKTAEGVLKSALANARQLTGEIKGAI